MRDDYTPKVIPSCGSALGPQGYGCFIPDVKQVPEPSALPLLLVGLAVLYWRRKV